MPGETKIEFDDPQTHEIIGAAMDVHTAIGNGFLEPVYKWALSIAFEERAIPFATEVRLPVEWHGRVCPVKYRVDFICYGNVIVEIKAIPRITPRAYWQAVHYVRAAKEERGLLLNFGATSLQYKRCTSSRHWRAALRAGLND